MDRKQEPKRGRGRPPVAEKEKAMQVSVSLRKEDLDALRAIAEESGEPVSFIVQSLFGRWLRRQVRDAGSMDRAILHGAKIVQAMRKKGGYLGPDSGRK